MTAPMWIQDGRHKMACRGRQLWAVRGEQMRAVGRDQAIKGGQLGVPRPA